MNADFLLACLHHIALLVLVGSLGAEAALLRLPPQGEVIARLARLDALYGLSALVLLLAGGARLSLGGKGVAFYIGNPVFWCKIAVFALIGLLSLKPTLSFLRWRRAWRTEAQLPDAQAWRRVRQTVFAEVHLLAVVVVCAAAMARGIGL